MKTLDTISLSIGTAISLLLEWLYGGFNLDLKILGTLMIIDIIGGLLAAGLGVSTKSKRGKISSSAMLEGLTRKVFVLMMLAVGHICDIYLGLNYIYNGVSVAFITREIISILEKYCLIVGEPPEIFNKVLDVLKGEDNDKD